MISDNFKSFPKAGKLLGLDWGERNIGVAVSSPDRKFVFARKRISDSKNPIPDILKITRDEGAVGIVLGLPLRLDGTESGTTAKVRSFAGLLAAASKVPVILFDESLTSFEAGDSGAGQDDLDSESARVILENAIAHICRGA